MNKIYDNGYQILGSVKNIKKYIKKCIKDNESEEVAHDELSKILEELSEYEDKDIAYIDYDKPMWSELRIFTQNDKMSS